MISFIVCSVDQPKLSRFQQNVATILGQTAWEIVVIPDAQSLAEGYQRGIAASRGETLVFSHDDIEILSPDFAVKILSHLQSHDLIGVAGTTKLINGGWISAGPPHILAKSATLLPDGSLSVDIYNAPSPLIENIQAMDGLFLAAKRSLLDKITFDARTFDGFHLYDLDFTYAAHRAGMKVAVAADIALLHASGGQFDDRWKFYCERFENKWMPGAKHFPRHFQWTGVRVADRDSALAVMTPPHWTVTNPPSHG